VSARRRAFAIFVLLVACAGLLATSPPIIESKLTASGGLIATLTSEEPRATGRLHLSLTAAALPVDDGLSRTDGVLTLDLPGHLSGVIAMNVRGVDLAIVPGEEYGATVIPIEQLCRVAEPCERELEVSVEWLAPDSTSLGVTVNARLEMVYHEREVVPDGARIAIEQGTTMAPVPAGPTIRAATEQELIVLDTEHWAAARHVVLTASEAARRGEVLAFLDQRVSQLPVRDVSVTVVPDGAPDEIIRPDEPIDAFATCPETGECSRTFTVRFELRWAERGASASVRWSMGARATFPDADEVPRDASLSAQVNGQTDATTEASSVGTSASGEFEADGHAQVSIRIQANAASLPHAGFGYLTPAARAVLTLRSTGYATVIVDVKEEGTIGTSRVLNEGGEAHVFVNPLKSCAYQQACTRTLTINVTTGRPDGSAGTAEVSWELDLAIAYPAADAAPPNAQVSLVAHRDG
jgi:hypothetical protein